MEDVSTRWKKTGRGDARKEAVSEAWGKRDGGCEDRIPGKQLAYSKGTFRVSHSMGVQHTPAVYLECQERERGSTSGETMDHSLSHGAPSALEWALGLFKTHAYVH